MKKIILAIVFVAITLGAVASNSHLLDALRGAPVAAQEQSTLYAKVLDMPRGKQVEFYAGLTPAERSSLWRAHLGQSLASLNLNGAQEALVLEAMAMATPTLFDGSMKSRQTVREFTARVKEAFDKETAGAIFARMESIGIRAVNKPDCGCSLVSDWCFASRCYLGGCTSSSFGCGLMWVEACEGMCR